MLSQWQNTEAVLMRLSGARVAPFQGFGTVGGIHTQGVAAGLASFAPLVRKSEEEMVPQRAQSSQRNKEL